jgi:protein TonB
MKSFYKNRSRYSVALILSLVIHVFIFGYLYNIADVRKSVISQGIKKSSSNPNTVKFDSVKFITQKQLKEIKAAQHFQIVANETNGENKKPLNSRFLGEKDQSFERQTMAATNGAFKKAGLGVKEGAETLVTQTNEKSANSHKTKQQNKPKNDFKSLSLSDFGAIKISKSDDEAKIKEESDEFKNNSPSVRQEMAQGIAKGSRDEIGYSRNNDFVEEVPLGDVTNLNTTEFKYYGFYHRIRQKLEQHWGSTIQSKAKNLYRSGRRLPASENLITAITVVLDDHGQILDIKIEGTSGIRELDQAAIESFNKAGPFPNPPKGLLVDGRAIIQWGFVVKS